MNFYYDLWQYLSRSTWHWESRDWLSVNERQFFQIFVAIRKTNNCWHFRVTLSWNLKLKKLSFILIYQNIFFNNTVRGTQPGKEPQMKARLNFVVEWICALLALMHCTACKPPWPSLKAKKSPIVSCVQTAVLFTKHTHRVLGLFLHDN